MKGLAKWKLRFADWFTSYFHDQQGADSPYSFIDVKEAFHAGWKTRGKK